MSRLTKILSAALERQGFTVDEVSSWENDEHVFVFSNETVGRGAQKGPKATVHLNKLTGLVDGLKGKPGCQVRLFPEGRLSDTSFAQINRVVQQRS
jgi:hypothetical protein